MTSSTKGDANNDERRLVSAPEDNAFLCNDIVVNENDVVYSNTKDTWMVVPRGGCTYEHKTYAAQTMYKASGIIVYNTLASRYTFNETGDEIEWPIEYHDYDCDNAMAVIASNEFNFFSKNEANEKSSVGTGPYDSDTNDPVLVGDTADNLCKIHDKNNLRNCPSKRCLVAHNDKTTSSADTTTVCCAWDLRLSPGPDGDLDRNVTITIPTIFATMEQGDIIVKQMKQAASSSSSSSSMYVYASVRSLWRPTYNLSAVVIVLLGVFVAGYAAFRSADDYHIGASKLWYQAMSNQNSSLNRNPASAVCDGSTKKNDTNNQALVVKSNSLAEESLQLEPMHALVFLVISSFSLFILFFFKIYNVAKVLYAIGCANSFIQLMVYPLLSRFLSSRLCKSSSTGKPIFRERVLYTTEDFGDITTWDVLAGVIGYSVGLIWLYMSLCIPHAGEHYAFYWIAQDVLGFCICVTFLGVIELNSIQVGAILLIVAFFYDIFFVFVTPYLFKGRSVMIEVATSGGPPKADALWCEKYPSDSDCSGGEAMPMLFSIPRLFDYQGGASMLGLGDIVLPGLLLSFAARLDAAKLVYTLYCATKKNDRTVTDQENNNNNTMSSSPSFPPPMKVWYALLFGGHGYYFIPLMISYAVGLFMANAAVYLMEMGQPALLYIVPCTLGTMAYKGWKRSELMSLWEGPKVLEHADIVCYGRPTSRPEGGEAVEGNSSADEAGDVPLLSSNNNDEKNNSD